MIFILAPTAEKATNDVIAWLLASGQRVMRVTKETMPNISVNINGAEVSINDIKIGNFLSFWVRKGHFTYQLGRSEIETAVKNDIEKYLNKEFGILSDFVVKQLETKPHLGNYFESNPNKLRHLQLAQQAGLAIPQTRITQSKTALKAFKNEYGTIISKSIKDSFTGTYEGTYYYNHTERVTNEMIEAMPETFFPSLIQEELNKEYELRIVFVKEKVWAMAIFSQNDLKTVVDWRNYNNEKPNRLVPYLLPETLLLQIKQFARLAKLNTGAIDMVVTKDKRHVFLECNPNGQISMVSQKCNYPIEKYIADFLTNA